MSKFGKQKEGKYYEHYFYIRGPKIGTIKVEECMGHNGQQLMIGGDGKEEYYIWIDYENNIDKARKKVNKALKDMAKNKRKEIKFINELVKQFSGKDEIGNLDPDFKFY